MSSLETYLRGEYQTDRQQLKRTAEIIRYVAPIFVKYRDEFDFDAPNAAREQSEREVGKVHTWPYKVVNGESPKLERFSDSTHCMILFAMDAVLQATQGSIQELDVQFILFPERVRGPKLEINGLQRVVDKGKRDIARLLAARTTCLVDSKTFGKNDPFTLTWLAELILRSGTSKEDIPEDQLSHCKTQIRSKAQEVCLRGERVLEWDLNKSGPRHEENPHCFQMLRCVHLAKAAAQFGMPRTSMLELKSINAQTFHAELHKQLGYYSIPDSRFDPAVLVFAMEGVLQFDRHALSDSTVELVFRTLEESQKLNPYWRPVTPFLSDSQGMVLFPVSVEISNSMLRCFELLNDANRPAYLTQLELLLRRYVKWLLARAERIRSDDRQFMGWHSEHVNHPGTIHLWETSQVLLFLVHYCSLLQRKIATEGLKYAGLTIRDWESIDEIPAYWKGEPLDALSRVGQKSTGNISSDGQENERDPADRRYAVLSTIYHHFVEKRSSRSLLLYGPPGTGKTTVAEQMAVALKQRLLTITVSDFLADAADEVEARAKSIFQVLEEQEDVVILFDEMDQFLLDRTSEAYKKQTGVFQFLTPGMLTKFQNLKDRDGSIFIVATNYEERIDSAIKRQGRFDHRLLLSLPDKVRREDFLWGFICNKLAAAKKEKSWSQALQQQTDLDDDTRAFVDDVKEEKGKLLNNAEAKAKFLKEVRKKLAGETALFGWGDLKYLVNEELKICANDNWPKVVAKLVKARQNVQPAVRLSAYKNRFGTTDQAPFEEFAILLYLVGEVDDVSKDDRDWIMSKIEMKNLKNHLTGSQNVRNAISDKMPASLLNRKKATKKSTTKTTRK